MPLNPTLENLPPLPPVPWRRVTQKVLASLALMQRCVDEVEASLRASLDAGAEFDDGEFAVEVRDGRPFVFQRSKPARVPHANVVVMPVRIVTKKRDR